MTAHPGRLEIGEVGECGQDRLDGGRLDGRNGARLARQRSFPLVGAVELREHVGSHPLEGVDDGRVVRPPAARAQPLARVVAQHGREIDVSRHQRDPHRERDRVAREPRRIALPIPALVGVCEGVDDRLLDARARRQHDSHLAVRGQRTVGAFRIGERARDQAKAPQRRLPGTHAAHEAPHHLPARTHQHRSHRGVEPPIVTADQRGRLRRVGRAAQKAEKRKLVDAADLVWTAAHLLGQGSSDRARAKRVAGPLTGPEVRGEGHRPEKLGQTK